MTDIPAEAQSSKPEKPTGNSLRRLVWLGLGAIVLGGIGLVVLNQLGVSKELVLEWVNLLIAFLETRPLLLLLSIAILPGFSFPLSPLVIIAGGVIGERFGFWYAWFSIQAAVGVCCTWSYFAAAYPLRGVIRRMLQNAKFELPDFSAKGGYWKPAIIVRATPGIPFAFQNFSLGVLRVPFRDYLIISFLVQCFYVTGFIMSGQAFLSGNIKLLLMGIAILVVVGILIQKFRKSLIKHK